MLNSRKITLSWRFPFHTGFKDVNANTPKQFHPTHPAWGATAKTNNSYRVTPIAFICFYVNLDLPDYETLFSYLLSFGEQIESNREYFYNQLDRLHDNAKIFEYLYRFEEKNSPVQ